jgi:hypothetical protein
VAVTHDAWLLTIPGYVHRIRCHSEGTTRRVMIGTQQRSGTDWFNLDDCSLEEQGLTTPAIAELRRRRSSTRLLGQPRQRTSVPPPAASSPGPVRVDLDERRPEAFDALETALVDGSTPADLRRLAKHAQGTLPANNPRPEEFALLQEVTLQIAQLSPEGRTGRDMLPSDGRQRLALLQVVNLLGQLHRTQMAHQRKPLISRLLREVESAEDWLQPRQKAEILRLRREAPPRRIPEPAFPPRRIYNVPVQRPVPAAKPPLDDIAGALRDVLTHTARLGGTLTWSQARRQVPGLKGLGRLDLHQVLNDAGKPGVRAPRAPHLAVLISNDQGEPLRAVAMLMRQQDRRFISPDRELAREIWLAAVQAVHAHYQPRP